MKVKNNGITLVALVVTIIVLLILAGTSIALVLTDNGLINKALSTKQYSRAASVQERIDLWNLEKRMNENKKIEKTKLIEQLEKEGLLTADEKKQLEEKCVTVIGDKTIILAETLVELYDDGKLKIGDYVDYKNPESGTKLVVAADSGMDKSGKKVTDQTFDISKNQLRWRVLGKDDETGGIKLIAETPMKTTRVDTVNDPYLYMYGAGACLTESNGNLKSVNILNDICSVYKNENALEARSINIDDINSITGITTAEKIKEANLDARSSGNKQYGDEYSYSNQWTPESYLEGKKVTVSGISTGYYYSINSATDETQPKVTDSVLYDLLFGDIGTNAAYYWLSSSGIYGDAGGAAYGPGVVEDDGGLAHVKIRYLFYSQGASQRALGYAVRPVVILNPEVTEYNVPITNQTEIKEEWNYISNPNAV